MQKIDIKVKHLVWFVVSAILKLWNICVYAVENSLTYFRMLQLVFEMFRNVPENAQTHFSDPERPYPYVIHDCSNVCPKVKSQGLFKVLIENNTVGFQVNFSVNDYNQ